MTVRIAAADDLDLVARICAEGFYDDPLMRWVMPGDDMRGAGLTTAFRGLATTFLGGSSALHVVDDACVTMWRTPAYVAPAPTDDDPSPWAPDVAERFRILSELMEHAHPTAPHWYLNVISTLPSHQGRGLGARALAPTLAVIDSERMPAYLESSNPRNMTLYRRHGFEEIDEPIQMPDGPALYPMWREPR